MDGVLISRDRKAGRSGSQFVRPVCVGVWLLLCCGVQAQQYPFLPVDGSPKDIAALFQDSKGRLWMAGRPPSVFDGARFYSLEDYGLPRATVIHRFAESPDGAVWMAALSGLYRYYQGHVEQITQGDVTSVIAPVQNMALVTMDGTSMSRTLVRFVPDPKDKQHWLKQPVFALDSPGPVTANADGTALAIWPYKGLVEFRIQDLIQWRFGTPQPQLRHIPMGVPGNGNLKAMRDQRGCLWLGVDGFNSATCHSPGNAPPIERVDLSFDMHETGDGNLLLWGPSIVALGRFWQDPELRHHYFGARPANGLPALTSTLGARDGTIWLGTPQGLHRFPHPFRLEYWTTREGVAAPAWSLARVRDRIYAGLVNEIVVLSRDRTRWEPFVRVARQDVTSLLATDDGNLLVTTQYGPVRLFSPEGHLLAKSRDLPDAGGNMRLTRGQDGEIWLAGDNLGILRRKGSVLTFDPVPQIGVAANGLRNALSLRYDVPAKRLWTCANNGLQFRDATGAWHRYTAAQGLAAGSIEEDGCTSLITLPGGDVLAKWWTLPSLGRITPIPDGPMPDSGIRVSKLPLGPLDDASAPVLELDHNNRIWRAGNESAFAATPEQALAGNWLHFDSTDGFRPGFNNGSFFADSDGSFWTGSGNDIFHYTPPVDLVTPTQAPELFVSAYSRDNQKPQLADAAGQLPYGTNAHVLLGTLQFDRRNALRIRYRFLPAQNWTDAASLDIPLGNIGSGPHVLEVQGRVFTGPWSQVLRHSLTVAVPVWRTMPWVLGWLTLLTLVSLGLYTRHRRRLAEEAAFLPDQSLARFRALLPEAGQVSGRVLASRFRVGELVARGGFASVLDAFDLQTRKRCAVKVFRNEVSNKAWLLRRFEQEVSALSRIRHPNVVTIYAHGHTSSGSPWLVMEFVEGQDLRTLLRQGALPPLRVAAILEQLASALDAIHAINIWHRDVKPENIIIRSDRENSGQAILIDFSIAIVQDADEALHGLSRAAGSFHYMAPEQAIGFAGSASDVYSLARVTLEMLTGKMLKDLLPDAALDLSRLIRTLLENTAFGLTDESMEMLASAQEFDPARRPAVAGNFAAPIVRDLRKVNSAPR